jgi:hypothetical protein
MLAAFQEFLDATSGKPLSIDIARSKAAMNHQIDQQPLPTELFDSVSHGKSLLDLHRSELSVGILISHAIRTIAIAKDS